MDFNTNDLVEGIKGTTIELIERGFTTSTSKESGDGYFTFITTQLAVGLIVIINKYGI